MLVEMRGITKQFGGVLACSDVDFTVGAGEVHALLGENGAGKSTLMNILSGVITSYEGSIRIEGEPVTFHRPLDAQRAGIAMIHQELDLVPGLSVAENLVLGREPRTRWRTVDRQAMYRLTRTHLPDIDPRRPVSSLRVGEQQLVEIAKALSLHARVLVMDEPTAALADAEVQRLFATIAQLRKKGVGIVYISHRMEEIEVIADRATVLRNGRVAGSVVPTSSNRGEVISLMVGRDVLFNGHAKRQPGPELLRHQDVTVHGGEIVGLAGLMGSGRTELLESLFGVRPGEPGGPRSPREALARGIAFVPEDRRGSALVLGHPVNHSIILAALRRVTTAGVVRPARQRTAVLEQLRALAIKTASPSVPVGTLSGGNQQKVVFARQLLTRPRLLLLDEPTRGVDVGAKAEIYKLLHELAASGMGILLASSELPELLGVCDRIVVLRRGQAVASFDAATTSGEEILAAAMSGECPTHDYQ
jgi:ribose transport system ATP-binding protein